MRLRTALIAAATVFAGLVSAVPAFAFTATSDVALHVRSGPNTGYPVVDSLYQGERVNVTNCSNGWCAITHSGPDGYASEHYLSIASGQSAPPPQQAPAPPSNSGSFQATSSVALNVRSGPATRYSVVDALYSGETVQVNGCSNGWCSISHSGPDGYVSQRYLTRTGYRNQPQPSSPPPQQGQTPPIGFCIDAPNFKFGVNCNPNPPQEQEPQPQQQKRVCFYQDNNFQGRSFCARPGQGNPRMRAFNDEISSIKVFDGATAYVCEDYNFQGRCTNISRDMRSLGNRNNDIISSFRVRR